MNPVLVTGSAGFIGMHCALRLLERGCPVVGLDNLNSYYDVALKQARLAQLQAHPGFRFVKLDLADRQGLAALFDEVRPHRVLHLAAQAGVRYSIEHPDDYTDANLLGFANLLQCCRKPPSGTPGLCQQLQRLWQQRQDAVCRKRRGGPSDQLLRRDQKSQRAHGAHVCAPLRNPHRPDCAFSPCMAPWGRPDMALFKFTRAMLAGETIDVYGNGQLVRDFTYIDDIVEGVLRVLDKPATPDAHFDPLHPNPATSSAPYRIFNIGNSTPTVLLDYIAALEAALGIKAKKRLLPRQPGDMQSTAADTRALQAWVNFAPATSVKEGVRRFVDWYRGFFGA